MQKKISMKHMQIYIDGNEAFGVCADRGGGGVKGRTVRRHPLVSSEIFLFIIITIKVCFFWMEKMVGLKDNIRFFFFYRLRAIIC